MLLGSTRRQLRGRDLALIAAGLTFYAGIAVVPLLLVAVRLTALVTSPEEVGTWGVATAHPRVVAASSGGTVRGGAVSGLGGYAAARSLLDRP